MKTTFALIFIVGLATGTLLGFFIFDLSLPNLDPSQRLSNRPRATTPAEEEIRAKLPKPNIPLILSHGSTIDVSQSTWKLRDLDNQVIQFSQLAGRVVFLNSWGTWCLPCVAEMPSIQALYDSLRGEAVAFVLFSDEDIPTLRSYAKRQGFRLPMYQSISDPPKPLINHAWPTTFILNKTGSIVYSETGGVDWNNPDVIRFLRNLN